MPLESIDVMPGFAFLREGVHTFAKNVTTILEIAEPDAEMEQVLEFLRTLPRAPSDFSWPEWQQKYCNQCLKKAYEKSPATVKPLVEYMMYFADRSYTAQALMTDAFWGIVTGVDAVVKGLKGKEVRNGG